MSVIREPQGNRISRRTFLNLAALTTGAVVLDALNPRGVEAVTQGEAAVRLRETSVNVLKDPNGNIINQTEGVRSGNDYVLSPTQLRGQERTQRVLVRIGANGVGRELFKVVAKDGSHTWRTGGDTFVFSGRQDTVAPVQDVCEPVACGEIRPVEYRPGMNIDVYRVRRGGGLEYFLTFPTAFDCNPRDQRVIDTITEEQTAPTPQPRVEPTPAPTPKPAPVPAPVQLPRASYIPLSEEYGSVDVVDQGQLGRTIYE